MLLRFFLNSGRLYDHFLNSKNAFEDSSKKEPLKHCYSSFLSRRCCLRLHSESRLIHFDAVRMKSCVTNRKQLLSMKRVICTGASTYNSIYCFANDSSFGVLRKLFALLERTNTSAINNRDRISPTYNDIFQVGPFILSLFACPKELTWA